MFIGGWQKFSLLDYPEHISAIVFTGGCNFRCQFCYNPMLVWPISASKFNKKFLLKLSKEEKGHHLAWLQSKPVEEDDLFRFLKKRRGRLDGVVITGGEPTLQSDLPDFIRKIKEMGYLVKLDTNGTNPEMLKMLVEEKLVDYIAMDIKGPEEKYKKITGRKVDFKKIKKSVKIIIESKLPPSNWAGKYEFRTTIVPALLKLADIKKIGEIIKGADKWFLQKFKSDNDLVNKKFNGQKPFTDKETNKMMAVGRRYVKSCFIR